MELHVRCVEAKDVPKMDFIGKSDPYLSLKLSSSNQVWKTSYKKNTYTPNWNQEFHLPLTAGMDDILTVTMYDKDLIKDDIISHCQIHISELQVGKVTDEWFYMTPEKGVKKGGKVRLFLLLTEPGNEPSKNT